MYGQERINKKDCKTDLKEVESLIVFIIST